ncbi:MAG TPA: hypothetical protein VFN43_12450 [Humibacillus sp.]|nr:hypothetical protein [Humibacillus sp.]
MARDATRAFGEMGREAGHPAYVLGVLDVLSDAVLPSGGQPGQTPRRPAPS